MERNTTVTKRLCKEVMEDTIKGKQKINSPLKIPVIITFFTCVCMCGLNSCD